MPVENYRLFTPWVKINIFPFETILALKFELIEHSLFDGLDMDDLLLLSADKSIVFDDNKRLNDYKGYIKDKCSIYAIYFNKFATGWSSIYPIRTALQHQNFTKIMDRFDNQTFGYFNDAKQAMHAIAKSMRIRKKHQLFISTADDTIFEINDILNDNMNTANS